MTAATALLWSAILAWLMLATASFLRARAWNSAGLRIALGNRDDLPPATGLAGRADRAARNMVENLVLLVALVAAVYFAGKHDRIADAGATIFFWSPSPTGPATSPGSFTCAPSSGSRASSAWRSLQVRCGRDYSIGTMPRRSSRRRSRSGSGFGVVSSFGP